MTKKIIYPTSIQKLKCIGVTAPSTGLFTKNIQERFDLLVDQYQKKGIEIIEGNCLRKNHHSVSGSIEDRIQDFNKFWNDSSIDLIQPPWGGEILIELLEHIDFESLKSKPKWIQGYSDITTLLLAITLKTGIATAHGTNFIDSIEGQDHLTTKSRDYLYLNEGDSWIQLSSGKWQKNYIDFNKIIDAPFHLTEKTEWKILNRNSCEVKGRIIGGCFDILKELLGTPYGDLKKFAEDYCSKEGLLLYIENAEQSPFALYRSLISMKYVGWFDYVEGIIFGRNSGNDQGEFSYLEAIRRAFPNVKFPIIWDADIGHKSPQMTMINGSVGHLKVEKGKAILEQKLI